MRCIILRYLSKNRSSFHIDELVETLYETGKIEEEDKNAAYDALDGLYNEGLIVPKIFSNNGEIKFVYMFEPEEEVIYYLQQNGGREKIGTIADALHDNRGVDYQQTKAAITDLLCDKKIVFDQITMEVFIPRTDQV